MSRRARQRHNKRAPWQDQADDTTGADCGLHSQQESDQVNGDKVAASKRWAAVGRH